MARAGGGIITGGRDWDHQLVVVDQSIFEIKKMMYPFLSVANVIPQHDGSGLALASLLLALGIIGLWFWAILAALFVTLPLGALGLFLGVLGLRKARQWRNNRRARTLAVLGIVLNSCLIGGFIVLLVWAFSSLGQQ